MDVFSAQLANALLNNAPSDAVLEITQSGPQLLFSSNTVMVLTGANISPHLNGVPISQNKRHNIQAGDVLSFGKLIYGARCYLAVAQGFKEEVVLGSRSYCKGISRHTHLKKGMTVPYREVNEFTVPQSGRVSEKNRFFETNRLEVTIGPDLDLFSPEEIEKITTTPFTISSQSNRVGYRTQETVVPHSHSILTSPVLPGTVQLIPSGNPILLMKDAQTTGGYPRLFQLTEKAIAILAQKKAGDSIAFSVL